ncbi:MAG: ATP-binding protein [Pseudomonadota bacterium]
MKYRLSVLVFFSFAVTSLVSALAIAAALSLNLNRGFSDYVLAYEEDQLAALVKRVEQRAATLPPDEATLANLFADRIAGQKKRLRRRNANHNSLWNYDHTHRPPESIRLRLSAFDENGKKLFGPSPPPPPSQPQAPLEPGIPAKDVFVNGRKIGSLSVLPRGETPNGMNVRFLENQYRTGALIILVLLLLSLVPAWFAARNADRIVRGVKDATGDIVSGGYRKRAPDSSVKEVSEITDNINLLAEELQRLADLRRKWLAETSHELRTPLAAMTAEVDALADGVRPYSPDAISSLQEEAGSLGRLVNDLHFLAVADLSAPSYNFMMLDPVALCRDMVDRFKLQADNAELGLELDVQIQSSLAVKWDKGRIEQVLSNILTNSIRYTDAPGKVLVSMQETSSSIILTFEDTPPGVGSDDLQHLFEPLFRGDATRDRATGGTGLGLSVTQTIVQMHGGTIDASPSDLGGLRIIVALPKRPDQA